MIEKVIIAGAGGQGIMLLGKVLAQAAMRENKFVTCLPSYGAEVRGGTAHCMVVISDRQIGSPYVEQADTLILMNKPSLEKFKCRIKDKGLFIVNSSLCVPAVPKNIETLRYPFTDLAIKLGNIRVANMIALGCFVAARRVVHLKSVFCVISDIAPEEKKDLIEINKKALSTGINLVT
jgi:2-oxoglutarate ferredoxin oxidoreductase subunit gamma